MVAIDANILVRLVVQDVPDQTQEAQKIVAGSKLGSLWLDKLIIGEVTYVLRSVYGYQRTNIVRAVKGFINDERFYVPNREMMDVTVGLFESEKPLSFEDCWLLALKQTGKVKSIATFDTDILKRL